MSFSTSPQISEYGGTVNFFSSLPSTFIKLRGLRRPAGDLPDRFHRAKSGGSPQVYPVGMLDRGSRSYRIHSSPDRCSYGHARIGYASIVRIEGSWLYEIAIGASYWDAGSPGMYGVGSAGLVVHRIVVRMCMRGYRHSSIGLRINKSLINFIYVLNI